ncbi:MAG: AfsA-related hotdog domain-containing protein [Helicobacter sp.]|uniref:AfsA-related hotdog domain-containing protein n=1 Tax=Helicobacter sp. TaxID=218 RepID=UPI002A912FC1|nr:AfsA-related hotdog domain-containing protein [Helicobacter sp.]MDY5822095.1 AfsA-related hotdog domain-containing protein [Helicobacter sp.]
MTKRIDKIINPLYEWSANFSQNICKELVHKSFNSEVFLTDSYKTSNNSFLVSAFLPKTHIYYNDIPDSLAYRHDVSLLLEVFRQTSIYAAHKFYDVPMDSKFIFESADFKIFNHNNKICSIKDYQAIVGVNILEKKNKKNLLCGLVLEMTMFIDSKIYANKVMVISWLKPQVWNKLRKSTLKNTAQVLDDKIISKSIVGKRFSKNVVISDIVEQPLFYYTSIIPNQTYPAFFDHPLDHIPAALLIEALRQSSISIINKAYNILLSNLYLTNIEIHFESFCEFENKNICIIEKESLTLNHQEIKIQAKIKNGNKTCVSSKLKFIVEDNK